MRDCPLAVYAGGRSPVGAVERAVLLRNWSRDLVVFSDGPSDFNAAGREKLGALGVPVNEKRIARLEGKGDGSEGLSRVVFEDASSGAKAATFLNHALCGEDAEAEVSSAGNGGATGRTGTGTLRGEAV